MSKGQKTEGVQTKKDAIGKSDASGKADKKKWGILATIAMVLIAFIAGISIYNAPGNRLSRQLDLGQRYLEEQNYEQAAVEFDKAIAIDERCLEAYAGGIEAYLGLGDTEGLTNLYERALEVMADLGESELAGSMEAVVTIYLAADDVYSDNPVKAMEILEEGLTLTEDERIREKLVEDYLKLAEEYAKEGDYEKAIKVLEEGYAKTGSESLKARIEEYKILQAQEEEAAKAARKAEAEQMMDEVHLWGLWQSYWQGDIYLSDMQIRELCEPLVDIFESYLKDCFEADLEDELTEWYYKNCLQDLSEIYFMLGEYDLCMEKRWQYYEACGSFEEDKYEGDRLYGTPVEHTKYSYSDDGSLYRSYLVDEYGRLLNCIDYWAGEDDGVDTMEEYEYGEDGKPVKQTFSYYHDKNGELWREGVRTFEYDSSGRILRRTDNFTLYNTEYRSRPYGEIIEETYICSEYEYHEGGFTQHVYTRSVYIYDAFHESGTVWEGGYYRDYVIDQYGHREAVGGNYGYYGNAYEREALKEQERD